LAALHLSAGSARVLRGGVLVARRARGGGFFFFGWGGAAPPPVNEGARPDAAGGRGRAPPCPPSPKHKHKAGGPPSYRRCENLKKLGLPIRSLETEWGPSQCEVTFDTGAGLSPADDMLLFRTAVKQICRRQGCHAAFMCWPAVKNVYASGWHLHQSLFSAAT